MRLVFKRKTSTKEISRRKKKVRVRSRLEGSSERPRLTVYKSLTALYVQIVDDSLGKTLVSLSSSQLSKGANTQAAKVLGEAIARKALESKIEKVVFDRNGYLYHGKIKALAEAARGAGLKF